MPIGKWHNKMESLFDENMREVKFYCSTTDTNVCRRADILLNNKRTCEVQHSYIAEKEIIKRFNDWDKFGKEIIWLVDGNNGIELCNLSTGNYLLIFKETWKYKSFISKYDFILLEINENVFKIELKLIKSGMIELKEPKTLKETIDYLKTKPNQIWDFWSDENTIKSTLSVYQQGAGNGKTYGIWQSILNNIDKKTYIILTKQHTAKTVIYEELKDQKERFINGEEVFHIENIENDTEENTEKHFVIKYTHKESKRECIVIIGTIDSFCYNLSTPNTSEGTNYFESIINNIKDNGATKVNNGYMRFAGQYIQLSKESEIWIDEVQDLPINYLHAMCKLIYQTNCNINVVGDKLQSLEYSNNFLTSIVQEGLPNITIDIKPPTNINRRIKVKNMRTGINNLINFQKYDLPPIKCDKKIVKEPNTEPIYIMNDLDELKTIYPDDKDKNKISEYCNKIMKYYENEVNKNNYLPKDFLIIFPVMKSNVIAPELEIKIQEFWINRNKEHIKDEYIRYVYLHKHEAGTVINTNDSINATRIMSIRASKGDGRNVVFILQVNEKSLKLVSNKETELVYESHLHVAFTRAKKQIYYQLIKNRDEIHKRFEKSGYVRDLPKINKKISLDQIISLICKNKLIEILTNNSVDLKQYIYINNLKQNEAIDWGYHCIKYQVFYYNIILNIIDNKVDNLTQDKSQLFVKLDIISRKIIKELDVNAFWKYLDEYQNRDLPTIPLCKLSKKPEYQQYFDIIKKTIKKININIQKNTLKKLNVYESIILTYIIEIFTRQRYSSISPLDIYNITNFFEINSNKEKELLNNIANIKAIIDSSGIKKYKNINWNIFKHIELKSDYDYFKLYNPQFPIIGYNDSDVIHIILKTNISELNVWDITIQILLERFLIFNSKSEQDNKRYNNKKINTYCFILDDCNFIKIDWEWDKLHTNEIKQELLLTLNNYYEKYHIDIYNYLINLQETNVKLWEESPSKIIDKIIKESNDYPTYIIDFLKDINTKIEEDDDYSYINNFETFNIKLNKKLNINLKKYFDI